MATKQKIIQDRMEKYNIKQAQIKPGETLQQAYKRLAKQADQRLVRLEAASREKGYEGILTYAYALAADDARRTGATDPKHPRFNTKPPESTKALQAKINDMIRFLNSPTSTKSGVTKMYKKRTETLNKKFGTNFTWQEAGRFFEKHGSKFNKKKGSSAMILKTIARIQKSAEAIEDFLNLDRDQNVDVSPEAVQDAVVDKLLKNGIKIDASVLFGDEAPGSEYTLLKEDNSAPKAPKSQKSRKSVKSKKAPKSRKSKRKSVKKKAKKDKK